MKKDSSKAQLISIFSNFDLNGHSILIKNISKQLSKNLISQLMEKKIKAPYLQKYHSSRLFELIYRLTKKGITKKEYVIASSIILILESRYKDYQSNSKDQPKKNPSFELMDSKLFPCDKITSVKGTDTFTIVNWKQLNIEINDIKPNQIIFKKIINGIPSDHKVFYKDLKDLHLGMTTRSIIKIFGFLDADQSYQYPLKKKDQVFRLNKALKTLFRIPRLVNPFFWKKNRLHTDITITAFDNYGTPVIPF